MLELTLVARKSPFACEAPWTLTRMPELSALRLLAAPENVVAPVVRTFTFPPLEETTNCPAFASTLTTVPRTEGGGVVWVGKGFTTGVFVARGVVAVAEAVAALVPAIVAVAVAGVSFDALAPISAVCHADEDAITATAAPSPATMSIPRTTTSILLRRKPTTDPPRDVWKEVPSALTYQ